MITIGQCVGTSELWRASWAKSVAQSAHHLLGSELVQGRSDSSPQFFLGLILSV
jgi:hypothetical protein